MIAIIVKISKEPDSWLIVREDESAEVARESLNTSAHGDKVVISRDGEESLFDKRLLERDLVIRPGRSMTRIQLHDVALQDIQIINVEHRSHAHSPITRLKAGGSFEQFKTSYEILVKK